MKYIKEFELNFDTNNKKTMILKEEYYVNQNFTGDSPNYVMSNRMLYQKFQAYLCQERGSETEDLALTCEPDIQRIDHESIDERYPLKSKSWLLFYAATEYNEKDRKQYEILLLPEYNQPKVVHLNTNDVGYYKCEYFFYHDQNYLVYHKQTYGLDHILIEIYKRNGKPYDHIKLKLEGCYDHSYARISLSPSGRYM